jgi:hypothetical protein
VAELQADGALGEGWPRQPCRQVERSDTLIRHARSNLRLAPPIGSLAAPVKPSALVRPLVPTVGRASLLASGLFAAWLTAIPLPAVATGAHGEHRSALTTASGSENGPRAKDRAAHSGIMPQKSQTKPIHDDRRMIAPSAQMMSLIPARVQKKTISDDRLQRSFRNASRSQFTSLNTASAASKIAR